MESCFCNDKHHLSDELVRINSDSDIKSLLIFMADNTEISAQEMNELLKISDKPLIGGVFPNIIFKNSLKEKGVLIIPLSVELRTSVYDLVENSDFNFNELNYSKTDEYSTNSGLFVFIDAFSQQKNSFIQGLFNYFGTTVNYLGGGAGSLSFIQKPCVLHNTGMYENAAVTGLIDLPLSIGVSHGWTPISEPMKVTESIKNQIITIDWEPAFTVYKKFVEPHSQKEFTDNNFFEIAKSYPLGMVKLDSEMVIRDPFMVEGDVLHIVDEVPQGEYVSIMKAIRILCLKEQGMHL